MKALACLALATFACGGRLDQTPDASDGAADVVSINDAGTESGTKCEAPSGVSICGGPNDCGADCQTCIGGDASVRACGDVNYDFDAGGSTIDSYVCPDGAMDACIDQSGLPECLDTCVTMDLPELYLMNGRPDLARYSDRASFTGDPIPAPPTSCPSVSSGLELCGGACGACTLSTDVCTGRSPLHAISLCVPAEPTSFPCVRGSGSQSCSDIRSGYMCLTYTVDAQAQPIADQNSLCVPSATCEAAAQSYPGGAACTAGSIQ
jgi:hypothetical protein